MSRRTHDQKIPRNPCSVFKKVTLDMSVTFVVPQMIVVAKAFMADTRFPKSITRRAVNGMGKHGVPLRLHCARNITFASAVAFGRICSFHLFEKFLD